MESYCDRFLKIRAHTNQKLCLWNYSRTFMFPGHTSYFFYLTSMNSDINVNGTLLRPLPKDSSPYQPKAVPWELF